MVNLQFNILAEPYKLTIVGKFVHRRPPMFKVHDNFSRFGFCGDYSIGLIDAIHILIHLEHEDNYARFFLNLCGILMVPL